MLTQLQDSAEWYENERECGRAILNFCKATGTPREEIFYTSKLKNNAGYAATKRSIQQSLEECGLGYIDLYLIHGPWGGPKARREAWEAIVDVQKTGVLKSVGISTFGVRHMEELFGDGKLPTPAVHQVCCHLYASVSRSLNVGSLGPQIDLHPFMTRSEIVAYSRKCDIALEVTFMLCAELTYTHLHHRLGDLWPAECV